jgi:hypothetical protein
MNQETRDGWEKCPAGELSRLADRLNKSRVCRALWVTAAVLITAGAVGLGAARVFGELRGPAPSSGCASPAQDPAVVPAPCPPSRP